MVNNKIELRKKTYFKLSSQIAQFDNTQLYSILNNERSNKSNSGWGINNTISFGEHKVFIKSIPITDVEYENMFSTKNLYNLPTYYSYGIGSMGFGSFRELITYIKTTNWVLEGAIATFPLMYHYRIVPFTSHRKDIDEAQLKSYVDYWGGNKNVRKYFIDRAKANYELVLFLEYIPYTLEAWLKENPDQLKKPLNDLRKTINFLRKQEIIHFDAHFRNVLTDGDRVYLTDFGLALDKSFTLTPEEKSFFEQNIFYDYGEVLRNISHMIQWSYDLCSQSDRHKILEKYQINKSLKPHEVRSILLDNIEDIHSSGAIELDDFFVASIVKYRSIIALMQDFLSDMFNNNRKDTKLDRTKLQQSIEETGFSD